FRGVGINQARVHMQLLPIDQTCFHTLRYSADKQTLKHLLAPARSRLRQHAVIGNLLIKRVIQKPEVIESLRDDLHQLALARHIIKEEQKHHLQDRHRIHRDVTLLSIAVRHFLAYKTENDCRLDLAQRMIGSDPLLQVDRVVKELRLALLFSHHDVIIALPDRRYLGYYFFERDADLGNTPLRC